MGILWPRSNMTVFNSAGTRAAGAKAYFFEAGTTTPRTTYQEAALTTPHSHPVVADGFGRLPAIFLAFGDYRERIRTSADVTIWDTDNIPNPSPVSDEDDVNPNDLLITGDVFFNFKDGTRDGAVRCNGRTIGSATSGATERANPDTSDLFSFLWNNLSNAVCPVSGGRGASASTDFAANKTVGLPDLRGSVPGGLDTMGNSAASRFDASVPFSVGNSSTAGSVAGLNHHVLTTAQLGAHTHGISITSGASGSHTHSFSATTSSDGNHAHAITITDPGHAHNTTPANSIVEQTAIGIDSGALPGATNATTLFINTNTTGITASSNTTGAHAHTLSGTTGAEASHTHLVSGTSASTGSDAAHNTTQRTVLGTWLMKL